jgi:hypothetical protein
LNPPAIMAYWHLASLDAPTVAVVWSLAFAFAARVRLAAWVLPLEALVVWAVYVGDRLLDARRGLKRGGIGMHDRHWFHWRHRRMLAPMAIAATLVAAYIALRWMPWAAWGRDSVVGLASFAYFTRVHRGRLPTRIFSKEMLVGLLFAAGCALPALSRDIALPLAFFAALAWLNCWAIDRWEAAERRPVVRNVALMLATAGLAAAACLLSVEPRAAALLLSGTASAILLSVLDQLRERMAAITVRALADLVLLTPALLLAASRVMR